MKATCILWKAVPSSVQEPPPTPRPGGASVPRVKGSARSFPEGWICEGLGRGRPSADTPPGPGAFKNLCARS